MEHPEKERYPDGVTWSGKICGLRPIPSQGRYQTVYITIPKITVERFHILVDDEVSVQVGDVEPGGTDEQYHVSTMGGAMVIILSKLQRWIDNDRVSEGTELPEVGSFATIRMESHPSPYGRWDLCPDADRALMIARGESLDKKAGGEILINPPKKIKPRRLSKKRNNEALSESQRFGELHALRDSFQHPVPLAFRNGADLHALSGRIPATLRDLRRDPYVKGRVGTVLYARGGPHHAVG